MTGFCCDDVHFFIRNENSTSLAVLLSLLKVVEIYFERRLFYTVPTEFQHTLTLLLLKSSVWNLFLLIYNMCAEERSVEFVKVLAEFVKVFLLYLRLLEYAWVETVHLFVNDFLTLNIKLFFSVTTDMLLSARSF